MSFVLDASVALAWCFHDEANEHTASTLERLKQTHAFVPGLWFLEIGNILLGASRAGRIKGSDAQECIELLEQLPIYADESLASLGFNRILKLAQSEGLTTYDATYLELALRKDIPIASNDKKLIAAAQRLQVPLLA